ncbi:hypothetical protein [Flammeovirga kamogawensis]|uniref:Lipoprotein n=1 Tax=Flammeovirga kamogawensis TaxID=373891 RepID=A0ABX8GUV7_9BACT|nr:hypothetical protein [Flammeovirga kamogawensis]MBB6461695.1 hypothetical protein [Flammeovirga kamogawensis]QWG07380.1 hypothetical protein KM029_00105 [Flammeovirga kamogawensis]TRX69193.1 hypothetical protein EO216_14055 [Flammeovirga kamogawensis]
MIKFISKLTTIIGLIGLAFLVHSCGSDSEIATGNATFYADNTVGFSKQQIAIQITNKNDDEIAEGYLRQYNTSPNCGLETAIDVFTVDLPEGTYNVYAVEADSEDTKGAWFTGLEGYSLTITAGTCQRFRLGEDPFEEQKNPNARLRGLKVLTISVDECDCKK